jgi:hypothetical protein
MPFQEGLVCAATEQPARGVKIRRQLQVLLLFNLSIRGWCSVGGFGYQKGF